MLLYFLDKKSHVHVQISFIQLMGHEHASRETRENSNRKRTGRVIRFIYDCTGRNNSMDSSLLNRETDLFR